MLGNLYSSIPSFRSSHLLLLSSSTRWRSKRYNCYNLESPDVNRACIQCLSPIDTGAGAGHCSCCWATQDTLCDLEWSWGAVLATLSVSAVFATCSGILALAEKRRKRKGMSLARAWSIPHGMPVVRDQEGSVIGSCKIGRVRVKRPAWSSIQQSCELSAVSNACLNMHSVSWPYRYDRAQKWKL